MRHDCPITALQELLPGTFDTRRHRQPVLAISFQRIPVRPGAGGRPHAFQVGTPPPSQKRSPSSRACIHKFFHRTAEP
eukprot:1104355-Pleurochrysis_carterae.AAC.1